MPHRYRRGIAWIRRDLRVDDNTALIEACAQCDEVVPAFVLDKRILQRPDTGSARVEFLLRSLKALDESLGGLGGRLVLRFGQATDEICALVRETASEAVFFNREYEPHLRRRDTAVTEALEAAGVFVHTYQDQMLVEPESVLTAAGTPYTVYGAYARRWSEQPIDRPHPGPGSIRVPADCPGMPIPGLTDLGFSPEPFVGGAGEPAALDLLDAFTRERVLAYEEDRDFPARNGTSMLSRHLHFGTISPRTVIEAVRSRGKSAGLAGRSGVESFIREMAWREFYIQIVAHFPQVLAGPYQEEFRDVTWDNDEDNIEAWKSGQTGFPIVDAGMRQLLAEAWMPNRVRMIVATFLTKILLCDWRIGELYFMQRLVDGDLAANNGGWQWVAGTGPGAQPYFRIMNVTTQGQRYDPEGEYVRRWVPELARVPASAIHSPEKLSKPEREYLGCKDYPAPIVDHAARRQIALVAFQNAHRKARRQ